MPMTAEETRALRDAFGAFATGVTVVTTREPDGTPRGFTANSFTSVSLDPPLLLICPAKAALSCEVFAEAPYFAVNVLADDQKEISGLFASRSPRKFEQTSWRAGIDGMPILDGALARFECARHRVVDAGDHLIIIGRVTQYHTSEGRPLGYFRGGYFSIGIEEPVLDAAAERGEVSIGAIAVQDGAVLLERRADGSIRVPSAPKDAASHEGLIAHLKAQGLDPHLGSLYAVYRDSESGRHAIYYHGTVSGTAPQGMSFFALSDIPISTVSADAERSMLSRYVREHRHGSFGIYHGDEATGVVHRVAAPQA